MKTIKMDAKIYDLVNETPEIRAVLVSMGMTPIANDMNLNTVGRVVNLDMALKHCNVSLEEANKQFNLIEIEVETNE